MKLRHVSLVALALVLALSSGASADPKKRVVTGDVVAAQVATLTRTVAWHTSLPDALKEAKAKGKLVLWLHVKGELDGGT
jgi:hypothetical protein